MSTRQWRHATGRNRQPAFHARLLLMAAALNRGQPFDISRACKSSFESSRLSVHRAVSGWPRFLGIHVLKLTN